MSEDRMAPHRAQRADPEGIPTRYPTTPMPPTAPSHPSPRPLRASVPPW